MWHPSSSNTQTLPLNYRKSERNKGSHFLVSHPAHCFGSLLELWRSADFDPSELLQGGVNVEEGRESLRPKRGKRDLKVGVRSQSIAINIIDITVPIPFASPYSAVVRGPPHPGWSYRKASGDVWLEDTIKGALGEPAAVEGKDLGHVARAVFVMSAPVDRQRGLGVGGLRPVFFWTRRIKDRGHLYGGAVIRGITGMKDGSGVALRLRQRKDCYGRFHASANG